MHPTNGEISQQLLPTIRFQCSAFVEIEQFFPLQETMHNYKKFGFSPYDPTKLAIHSILRPDDDLVSKSGPNVKKTVCFDDVVHFIDEENIVIYVGFDCGFTFMTETATKADRSAEDGITFPDPVKNPSAFPATINMSVLLMNSIALISIWPLTFYGTRLQQL